VAVALPSLAFALFFLVSALSMLEPPYWRFGVIEGVGLGLVAISFATLLSGVGLLRRWRFARSSAAILLLLYLAFWGLGTLDFALALFFDTTQFVAEVQEGPVAILGAITITVVAFVWCLHSLWLLLHRSGLSAVDA
jgi:hypothetical protein